MSVRSVTALVPPLNPVLARELKQRMRGRHTWIVLTLYLAVLAAILRSVYIAASQGERFDIELVASASIGRAVFQWLLFFMLLLVCFIVPGLTAAAISGERERQTLVSLQITLLRPRSIVVGKLLASLAFVVLLIVASLPLVTVPFLVGGVALSEVVRGLVMVVATAVTLACVALACSALLRRTQSATVVAYGLTLSLVLGTLMVYGAQQIPRASGGPRPDPWILALNPFAATADVVHGRRETQGFASPFRPLRELLRLGDEERVSQVISEGEEVFVRPGPGGAVPEPMPPPPPFAGRPPVTGFVGGPGPAMAPGVAVAPLVPGGAGDDAPRLAGVRFWVVSLAAWLVLAAAALAVTIRRITLPRAREGA